MTYTYTPPGYLENGTYLIRNQRTGITRKWIPFFHQSCIFYFTYQLPPQKSFFEKNWMWMVLGGFIGAIGGLLIIL